MATVRNILLRDVLATAILSFYWLDMFARFVSNLRRFLQVYLHVDISYWPAVQLYESMGYEVVSMLEVKWEVREGGGDPTWARACGWLDTLRRFAGDLAVFCSHVDIVLHS